jgi:hypothetical protein
MNIATNAERCMQNLIFTVDYTRADWVKRFAYRAMLCRNELDTESAMLLADRQFDGLRGNNPEAAAEHFVGRTFQPPALQHKPYRDTSNVARRLAEVSAAQVSKIRVNATAVE